MPTLLKKSDWDETRCQTGWNAVLPLKTKWKIRYLLNCRSLTRSMFAVGVFSNWWIIAGIAAMIAAQLLFTYAPLMNRLFHTAPISGAAWLHILAVAVTGYAVVGVEKWIRCRWANARAGAGLAHNPRTSNTRRSL